MNGLRKLAAGLLLVLMFLGGIFMWAGNPYLWIRLTAAQADTQSLSMAQAFFILVAIAVTGFVMVKVLAWLNGLYTDARGGTNEVRIQMPWHQSMRDGREPVRTTSALDVVMVVSVSIALVSATIWFFFFASYG
jgi:hypothetical protein